jgi:hypothetical protein
MNKKPGFAGYHLHILQPPEVAGVEPIRPRALSTFR